MRLSILWLLALALPAMAQDDLRDVVTLKNGKELRGRVKNPFAEDVYVLMRGHSPSRVPVAQVKSLTLLREKLAEVLKRRESAKRNPRFHWMIAELAQHGGMEDIARLQALTVLRYDPDHEQARELLGHKKHSRRGWLWPRKSQWLTRDQFEEHHSKWGRALELSSEHFTIKTDAGIERTVDALFDLERLYVWVMDEFGPLLGAEEALDRMHIYISKSQKGFPRWSFIELPYYIPRNFGDRGYTWYQEADPRPVDLFTVAAQTFLYRCVAKDPSFTDQMDRLCPWVELGFSQYVQSRFRGDPGKASPQTPQFAAWELDYATTARPYDLDNMLHLTLRDHFYGGARGGATTHWSTSHLLVQFLMDPTVDAKNRSRLLTYIRQSLQNARGDSSDIFDEAMGRSIESVERDFEKWLVGKGAPKRRRRG